MQLMFDEASHMTITLAAIRHGNHGEKEAFTSPDDVPALHHILSILERFNQGSLRVIWRRAIYCGLSSEQYSGGAKLNRKLERPGRTP